MAKKIKVEGVSRADAFTAFPEELVVIGYDTDDGPEHPLYDPRVKLPLDEEKVKNYIEYGRRQNITCRKVRLDDGTERIEVVTGRRGTLYLREANKRIVAMGGMKKKIRFTFDEHRDDHMYAALIMLENEVRENDDFITAAEKAIRLNEGYGYSPEDIAVLTGKSLTQVHAWLATKELDKKVVEHVAAGRIGGQAAIGLVGLPPKEQREQVEKLVGEAQKKGKTRVSVRDVRRAVSPGARDGHPPKTARELRAWLGSQAAEHAPKEAVEAIKMVLGDIAPPDWYSLERDDDAHASNGTTQAAAEA